MPERAALIALLIVDRPLCLDCIAARADIPDGVTAGYLTRLRNALAPYHDTRRDRCRACRAVTTVYSLTRPPL